jgi:predicted DNA-binding transcriptional regulator AlpA
MDLTNLFNEDVLSRLISAEVEKLANIKFEEFKKDLAENYFFDDRLLDKVATAKKLDVSVRQLDNLVERGKLNKVLIGRSVKFKNSEVLEYINALK